MRAPTWGGNITDEKKIWLDNVIDTEIHPKFSKFRIYNDFVAYMKDESELQTHSPRYFNTFGMLCLNQYEFDNDNDHEFKNNRILELGGMSPISTFLSRTNDCCKTNTDLRYSIDYEDKSFDYVFSFEVFEHISDKASDSIYDVALFRESGIREIASEVVRVLKPGGKLIVTTPNPNSFRSLENLLSGQPPMIFRPHVREYTKNELCDFFSDLTLNYYETSFSFFMLSDRSKENWVKIFCENNWPQQHRGDDHFMIFTRSE